MYWAPNSRCPAGEGIVAFSTDDRPEFAYDAFNVGRDFGPLDIARTVMYCRWVDDLCAAHANCAALVHVTSDSCAEHRANSVALCGAYLVLALGRSAEEACRPFMHEPLVPFVDCRGEASAGSVIGEEDEPEFELSVLDMLTGLARARDLGWLDYRTFAAEEHANMLRPENGDLSWLIPGTAIALASPWCEMHDGDGLPVCTPAMLVPYFKRHGVGMVVQCNDPEREEEGERRRLLMYQPHSFEELGIRHVLLAFEDGGCPSVDILLRFLDLAKTSGCGFAVHCRSGLGRTATLIGAYAIQHLGFTARSFIGWARVMRPGTVHGSQQQYLCNLEQHIRVGALRPLQTLDPREQLVLLPHRELRFWALDAGIAAQDTRFLSAPQIVDKILETRRIYAPVAPVAAPSAALRAPDPAQLARMAAGAAASAAAASAMQPFAGNQATSLLSATSATAGGSGSLLALAGGGTGGASASAMAPPPAPRLVSPSVGSSAPPAARTAPAANVAMGLSSLLTSPGAAPSAAFVPRQGLGDSPGASLQSATTRAGSEQGLQAPYLGGGCGGAGAVYMRGLTAALSKPLIATAAQTESGEAGTDGPSGSDWDQAFGYLDLLAVQKNGGQSWGSLRNTLQKMRGICEANPGGAGQASALWAGGIAEDGAEAEATRQVPRAAPREATLLGELERGAAVLKEAQGESRDLQRECETLKFKLLMQREASVNDRRRMAEHGGETLDGDLRRDGGLLDQATDEVEVLRKRILRHEGLQWGQVAHVDQLQQMLTEAKRTAHRDRARCYEEREHLEAAQQDRELQRKPREAQREHHDWNDSRKTIEELRKTFHNTVQATRLDPLSVT